MTHYQILEIAETAGPEMIEAAWKIQMRACHPDHHKGPKAARRAQIVNAAHDVLSDPQKRAAYDLQLQAERQPRQTVRPIDQHPGFAPAFDLQQGYYPQPYANMEPGENFDPGQYFALKVGEALLESLMKKNPNLRPVFAAAKGAMKRK